MSDGIKTRALRRLAEMKERGMDPRDFTDEQLLKMVRFLGRKSLKVLREMTSGNSKVCPHCGADVEYGRGSLVLRGDSIWRSMETFWRFNAHLRMAGKKDGTLFFLKSPAGVLHLCELSGNMPGDTFLKAVRWTDGKWIYVKDYARWRFAVVEVTVAKPELGDMR